MRLPVLDKNFYPMIKALNDFDAVVKNSGKSVKVTLVAERSGGYVIAQLVTIASVGIVVTIGMLLIKSKYALILGLICAIFDIIPVVGPAAAFIICIIVIYNSNKNAR